MVSMKTHIKLKNTCEDRNKFCITCNSHFMRVKPLLKEIIISKHFIRDLKNEEKIRSIIKNILDCSHLEFHELHKFEENINGNLVFRARKGNLHIVYCVDKNMSIIFLRAFKNFKEYGRFLDKRHEMMKMLTSL